MTYPPSITSDTIRGTYFELSNVLGQRETRKIQNNTTLRREGIDLVIRYHSTDVLTYHGDDTVTIDTGGWHTSTTALRYGNWLPRYWSVSNDHGIWNVFGPTYEDGRMVRVVSTYDPTYTYPLFVAHHRVWDGMTITDTPRPRVVNYRQAPDFAAADNLASELERMVSDYTRLYTSARIVELFPPDSETVDMRGDCFYCLGNINDTGHLLSHLAEDYTMASLVRNAYLDRGYGDSNFVLSLDLHQHAYGSIRDNVKRFLLARLVKYGIPTVTRTELESIREEVAA